MEDEKIIEMYWARDSQAIRQTEQKYGAYCGRIAANILPRREDCEECVNDTWLRAWNSMPDERPDILSAFLGKITRNLSLDRYRKLHAAKRGGGETAYIFDEFMDGAVQMGPEDGAEERELVGCIDRFLAAQTTKNRVIFVRRYWYFDSIKDIAARCGVRENTVKSILLRMRGRLRGQLEKEGFLI